MAPPRNRRPGFSRRAQYGLFAGYVLAVSGIVVGLALVLIARFDPQGFGLLRAGATDATAPASGVGRALVRGVGAIGGDIGAYLDAAAQNRALRAELARDRTLLTNARALVHENRRLARLVRLAQIEPATVVATRIVASSAMSVRRTATIEAGALAGVRTGQPVRSPEGLIGRVQDVGQISARVVLLTDGGNTIPVRSARGGAPALTVGTGEDVLEVRGLAAGANPFRRGDLLVTSGTGGVYPPNVPVAVVTRVSGDRAVAMPTADPARIDFALVLAAAPAPPASPAAAAPAP